jgi:putative peptide zinc metalloprotease protein
MNPASQQPLPLHTRGELEFRAFVVRGQRRWSVKDPIALRYFQLRDEEHFMLEQLRRPQSLEEIRQAFETRFAPRKVAMADLHAFLGSLYREGLVVSDAPGQGEQLLERGRGATRRQLLGQLANVLAIRFRGVDAEPILARLYPLIRWVFASWFVVAACLFVLGVAAFAGVHAEELGRRLPTFTSMLGAKTLLWLAAAIGVSKVLHELGHGLTCRHVGGECHEIGVMLLVFTPCLYCNVTDIWMQPNKWRRAAVSAAGIAVELMVAAMAFVVWWNSQPGVLNSACFSLMLVGSVNSVLFNGNPLLRYDGYYVLSDLLEAPNLASQSSSLLRQVFVRWALGIEPARDELGDYSRWRLLLAYGIASTTYRLFVVAMIVWTIHHALAAWGLELVAWFLAATVAAGMIFPPAQRLLRFLSRPGAWRQMRILNITGAIVLLTLVAYVVAAIPVQHRVAAPALIQAEGAESVFVPIPGKVISTLPEGEPVERGGTICRLENLDLQLEVQRLLGQRDLQKAHVELLEQRVIFDESLEDQLPAAKQRLDDLNNQLKHKQADQDKLTVRAPTRGVVLATKRRPEETDAGELMYWTGSPTDPENVGCFLQRGQLLCRIGDAKLLEALLVVSQADVPFVQLGQAVTLQLDHLGGDFIRGEVAEIAEVDLQDAPAELVQAGELAAKTESDRTAPVATSYLVRVKLNPGQTGLLHRATGQARIHASPRSLWQRTAHYLARTFGFELVACYAN